MSPLARSLLALAATALLYGACAEPKLAEPKLGDSQCSTITKGHKEGVEKVLDDVIIPAGQRTASVNLPVVCIDNINLAEIATACDDVAPVVRLRNWPQDRHWPLHTTVLVTRNGNYEYRDAVLKVSLWCPH